MSLFASMEEAVIELAAYKQKLIEADSLESKYTDVHSIINHITGIQDPLITRGIKLLEISRNSDIRWDKALRQLDVLQRHVHENIKEQELMIDRYLVNTSYENDRAIEELHIAIHKNMLSLSNAHFDAVLTYIKKTHGYSPGF